jgi:tetratricopeptide (TPR) repeat protein
MTASTTDRLPGLGLLLVLLAASVPYLFGLSGEFVYDDEVLLVGNPLLQDLARLPELLTNSLWAFETAPAAERVDYWRPLTWLVFALTWAAGDGAVLLFKCVSLAAHLAAVAAVASFARRVAGRSDTAFAAALVFGLHPLGVEAVTWVSALNDPLMLALVFASLARFVDWRRGGSRGRPWFAAALFLAALLAKETALAFVFAFPLLDLVLLRDDVQRAGRERRAAPLFVGALAAYWLARVAVFDSWHGGLLSRAADFAASPLRLVGLGVEFTGGALALAAWPQDLAVFRPFRPSLAFLDAGFLVPFVVCIAASVALVLARRRDPRLFTALALGLLVLVVPALRAEALGKFPLSDRFAYAALPGLALAFVLALQHVAWLSRPPRVVAAACLLGALLGARGAARTAAWSDTTTFWNTAAEESPDVAHVWWNLGRLELARFKSEPTAATALRARELFETAADLAEAEREGRSTAVVTSFDVLQTNLGLGWSLLSESEIDGYGSTSDALLVFDDVVKRRPDSYEAWTGRGVALARQFDVAGAIESFTRALEIFPDYPEAHFNLGLVRSAAGERVKARGHFDRAFELRPSNANYAYWAAKSALENGDSARARELAERSRALDPREADPVVLLGTIESLDGDFAASLGAFDAALALEPNDSDAHNGRAKTLILLDRPDDALAAFVEAARLGRDRFEPHYNVASLLIASGADDATTLEYLQRAYELCPDPGALGALRGQLDMRLAPGAPIRATLALMDERRGQVEAALEWAESATEGDDVDGMGAYVYGRMLFLAGRAADALVWLERANEKKPDDVLRLRELGAARAAMDDADGARAAWNRALEVLPEPRNEFEAERAKQLKEEIEAGFAALLERTSPTGPTQPQDAGSGG